MAIASVQSEGPDPAGREGIVTPEAVLLDIETAGFASRILAGLIDLSIQGLILIVSNAVLAIVFLGDGSTYNTAAAFVIFATLFGYPIGFEWWLRGRTPGKVALGLRAVTVDGAPIRLREATLRAMGGIADRLLPPGGVTGALFVTLTPRHQRIGDLIAGTIVIRDPERHVASPALWFSPPPGLEAYAESIDPTAITLDQYTVIRAFLVRGRSMSWSNRTTLATDLADRLAVHIRHPRPHWLPPEEFLVCVMARYQRRNGPGVAAAPAPQPPAGAGMPGPPASGVGSGSSSIPRPI